ncbi:MAG TPA: IS1 family transposase [Candidatus Kapabacteria bacterium]|nr:IS1 family transposase [Candidatus Kapabacteria bacterium]
MNKLSREKQIKIVAALVEGNSIRAISRMTDVARNTISKLVLDMGEACQKYHDENVRGLTTKRVECDEAWSFVAKKDKALHTDEQGTFGIGSVWTWVAIDADSKLAISYLVGNRDGEDAHVFMKDVASRLTNKIQLTTDGHRAYLDAVDRAFHGDIDYAMLIKQYGNPPQSPDTRYSPGEVTSIKKQRVLGRPVKEYVSTSYVERQNLTMRMSMRRFTRLTNGFSKKVEFHMASVALHFMYYNFVRIHQTLRMTPAMSAGVTNHLWNMGNLVDLLDTRDLAGKLAALEI